MITAHMVVRNEADKLLKACLEWNTQWIDVLHIYDDQSTDDTADICRQYTKHVTVRPDDVPSFNDNEGQFRQAAWDDLETLPMLEEGDWIVCLDADEFFVAANAYEKPHEAVEQYIDFALAAGKCSVSISMPEIWDASGPVHYQRIDGFWRGNSNVRLVQYRKNGKFRDIRIGCGSVPEYGLKNPSANIAIGSLLHYGYAIHGAPMDKYIRYHSQEGNAHSEAHIQSIIATPTLEEWKGNIPSWTSASLSAPSEKIFGSRQETTPSET